MGYLVFSETRIRLLVGKTESKFPARELAIPRTDQDLLLPEKQHYIFHSFLNEHWVHIQNHRLVPTLVVAAK